MNHRLPLHVTFVLPQSLRGRRIGVLISDKLFGGLNASRAAKVNPARSRRCTPNGRRCFRALLQEADSAYLVKARFLDLAKHPPAICSLCHWDCAVCTVTSQDLWLTTLKMTPPCHNFHASQLPLQIQLGLDGKRRKTEGGKPIDLRACELLSLVQYDCRVERPAHRESVVRCYPVQRWFRRYGFSFLLTAQVYDRLPRWSECGLTWVERGEADLKLGEEFGQMSRQEGKLYG